MYFSLFSVFWIKTSQFSSRNGLDRKLDHCKVIKSLEWIMTEKR